MKSLWGKVPAWGRATVFVVIGIAVGAGATQPDTEKVRNADEVMRGSDAIFADARDARNKAEQLTFDAIDERGDIEAQTANARRTLRKLKRQISGAKRKAARRSFPGDGVYLVGAEVDPGTYRSAGGSGCYWERQDKNGEIIANDIGDGPRVVTIQPGDYAIKSQGCGIFRRQ